MSERNKSNILDIVNESNPKFLEHLSDLLDLDYEFLNELDALILSRQSQIDKEIEFDEMRVVLKDLVMLNCPKCNAKIYPTDDTITKYHCNECNQDYKRNRKVDENNLITCDELIIESPEGVAYEVWNLEGGDF